jgi:NAD(P)-dependent dehydrogenase (short-subunit alcohol dehydrogenase family)
MTADHKQKDASMLSEKTAVIIGGSSGMGLRVAELVIAGGGRVVIGSRSQPRIDAALAKLGPAASGHAIDNTDRDSIARFFAAAPRFDYLFTPGASYALGKIDQISDADAESPFRSKFWGQYWAVKAALPKLAKDGAIVLMSGAASVRPVPGVGAAAYVACNAAIEGLARGLAVELAPIRVNAISPGTTDGTLWRNRPDAVREAAFTHYAGAAALGRVGTEDEVARAVLFLFENTVMTGATIYADAGYALR